jgi:hypothetical protein
LTWALYAGSMGVQQNPDGRHNPIDKEKLRAVRDPMAEPDVRMDARLILAQERHCWEDSLAHKRESPGSRPGLTVIG